MPMNNSLDIWIHKKNIQYFYTEYTLDIIYVHIINIFWYQFKNIHPQLSIQLYFSSRI